MDSISILQAHSHAMMASARCRKCGGALTLVHISADARSRMQISNTAKREHDESSGFCNGRVFRFGGDGVTGYIAALIATRSVGVDMQYEVDG